MSIDDGESIPFLPIGLNAALYVRVFPYSGAGNPGARLRTDPGVEKGAMFEAMAFSTVLVLATVLIHYEALPLMTDFTPRLHIRPRARIVFAILCAFLAHTIEVWLFAGGLYEVAHSTNVGRLRGIEADNFASYLYFSTTTFTSLGLGDIWPEGALRLMAGVEALTGLVLIGWTASYTYLAMREFWGLHGAGRSRK